MNLLAVFRNGSPGSFKAEVCRIWSSKTQMNKQGKLSRQEKQHDPRKVQRSWYHAWEVGDRCKSIRCLSGEEASQVGRNCIIAS